VIPNNTHARFTKQRFYTVFQNIEYAKLLNWCIGKSSGLMSLVNFQICRSIVCFQISESKKKMHSRFTNPKFKKCRCPFSNKRIEILKIVGCSKINVGVQEETPLIFYAIN